MSFLSDFQDFMENKFSCFSGYDSLPNYLNPAPAPGLQASTGGASLAALSERLSALSHKGLVAAGLADADYTPQKAAGDLIFVPVEGEENREHRAEGAHLITDTSDSHRFLSENWMIQALMFGGQSCHEAAFFRGMSGAS